MKVAVIGLGLIGGSLAKAFKETGTAEVFALDKDASMVLAAKNEAIEELKKYSDAVKNEDRETLRALFDEGTKIKESIG